MSYDVVVTWFEKLVSMPWDMLLYNIDVGMDEEYTTYFAIHPFLRLIDPDEPIPAEEDDDDDEDGGRGGWRR